MSTNPVDQLSTGGSKVTFDPGKLPSSGGSKASFNPSKVSAALERWQGQQQAPYTPPQQALPTQPLPDPAPKQPYQPPQPEPPTGPTYEPPAQSAGPTYQAPAQPSYDAQPSPESPEAAFEPSAEPAGQGAFEQQPTFDQPAPPSFAYGQSQPEQPAGPVYVQKQSNLARDVAVSVGSIVLGSLIVYALTRSKD